MVGQSQAIGGTHTTGADILIWANLKQIVTPIRPGEVSRDCPF